MLPIRLSILPAGNKCRPGTKAEKRFIVIHDTGNASPGADADNHARYLQSLAKSNTTYLSWHFTVDDRSVWQHIPTDEVAWNAGDGATGSGNVNGIAIEICVNPESNFDKALQNTAELAAFLMKSTGITPDGMKQHNFFSGKNCPATLREQGRWESFVQKCAEELAKLNAPPAPVSSPLTVGSVVVVRGSGYASSYATGNRTRLYDGTRMKIVRIYPGRPAPYGLTQLLNSDVITGYFAPESVTATGENHAPGGPAQRYTVTAPVSVNVRTAPGGTVIDWYLRGREVDVLEIKGGWAKIRYGDGAAYVYAAYLKKL